jgi:hypothetical protein
MERVLDELHEDIAFLAYGMSQGKLEDLHYRYLDAFYEEEFDRPEDPLRSTQKRPSIPRQKIRAYIAQIDEHPIDSNRAIELSRTFEQSILWVRTRRVATNNGDERREPGPFSCLWYARYTTGHRIYT